MHSVQLMCTVLCTLLLESTLNLYGYLLHGVPIKTTFFSILDRRYRSDYKAVECSGWLEPKSRQLKKCARSTNKQNTNKNLNLN